MSAPSNRNRTPTTPMSSSATARSDIVPATVASGARFSVTVGGALSFATVTRMPVAVSWPAASRAIADTVWVPLETLAVFHTSSYGAAPTSGPIGAPSIVNRTPVTPMSSVAAASTATVPARIAPGTGVVNATVGGSASLATVTLMTLELSLPAASWATAVNTWLPLETVLVVQDCWNGSAAISAANGLPSSRNLTPVTARLSNAEAETSTLPNTEPPFDGAVSVTVGGVASRTVCTALARFSRPLPMPMLTSIGCAFPRRSAALV